MAVMLTSVTEFCIFPMLDSQDAERLCSSPAALTTLPLLPLPPLPEQHLLLQQPALGAVEGVEEGADGDVPALAGPADLGLDLLADVLEDASVERSLVLAAQEILQHL